MSRYQDDFELSNETRKTVAGASKESSMSPEGILVEVKEETEGSDCQTDCVRQIPSFIDASLRSRYLFANVVYCAYAFLIVYIDQKAYPDANALYTTDDDYADNSAYTNAVEYVNNLYVAAAIIHLINAFMYAWAWLPLGFNLCSVVMIPEYLNMIGASLYLYTATLYSQEDGTFTDDVTYRIHNFETAAASIEVVAAVGWVFTWYLTYPRGHIGRGWTLDDPDTFANVLIFVPSIYYAVYNAQILADPTTYCCNTLYSQADTLYAIGSIFYLLAALRDDGYFTCMPAGGICKYGLDNITPLDPLGTENAYPTKEQAAVIDATGRRPRRYLCGIPPLSRWPCFAFCVGSAGANDSGTKSQAFKV